jgi:Fe-S-cluster-containing dehydrogenase component
MQKRADDIVISDPEICIGCQTCAVACPFGIPQLNPGQGKIAKCDGCADRVEQGLSPACVLACPTGALRFVTPTNMTYSAQEQAASVLCRYGASR